jgi:hypothetical protein
MVAAMFCESPTARGMLDKFLLAGHHVFPDEAA